MEPVRVKKTRQNENPELRADFIGTEMALGEHSLGGYIVLAVQNDFDLLTALSTAETCERIALLTIHAEPDDVPATI
jgi:hypothetical protein